MCRQGRASPLRGKEGGVRRNQPCWHPELRLTASRTGREHVSAVYVAQAVPICHGSLSNLITDSVLFLINFLFCQGKCLAQFLAHGAQMRSFFQTSRGGPPGPSIGPPLITWAPRPNPTTPPLGPRTPSNSSSLLLRPSLKKHTHHPS